MTTTRHCQPFSFLHNTFVSAYQSARGRKTVLQGSEAFLTQETTPRTSTTNSSQNSGVSSVHDFVPLELLHVDAPSHNSTKRQGGYYNYASSLRAPEAAHLASSTLVSAYQDLRRGRTALQHSEEPLANKVTARVSTANHVQNRGVSSSTHNASLETVKTVSPSHDRAKRQGEIYINSAEAADLPAHKQIACEIARDVYPEGAYTAPVSNLVQSSSRRTVHFETPITVAMPSITVEAPSDPLESMNLSLLEEYLNDFPEDTSDRLPARMGITRADSDIGSVIGSESNSKIIEKFPETPANKPLPVSVQKLKPILKKPKLKATKPKPAPIKIPQTGYYTAFNPSSKLLNYQHVSTQKRSFETTRIDVEAIENQAAHIKKTPPRNHSLTWNDRPSDAHPQNTFPPAQAHTRSRAVMDWLDKTSNSQTEQLRKLYQEGTGYPNIHITSPELSEFQEKYTKAKQQQNERQKIDSRNSIHFQRLARMV